MEQGNVPREFTNWPGIRAPRLVKRDGLKIPLATGLGDGGNLLVVRASDVLVSVAGGYGTLSEIALSLKANKPVIGLETWENIQDVQYVSDPEEAMRLVEKLLA